ncbi:lipopolysaccharide assembly protein LapB [Humibacillus sp. DSM 29435]|uniref:tetratricopeptide repeat protein n=1 Tax=Humibacillus sp. DSM 29435 TaxID=1869167 RepID=UPI0020C753C5|nr:hypothetical protein [Humibacillus sp. DSM 29435]
MTEHDGSGTGGGRDGDRRKRPAPDDRRPARTDGPVRRGRPADGGRAERREDSPRDGARGGSRGAAGRTSERDRPTRDGSRRANDRDGSAQRRDDRPRGGGGRVPEERGGTRLTPKSPRLPEPRIREGVTGKEIDRGVKNQLRTLSKENAEGVAQHLVMVAELLDVEPQAALAHAETAVRRAGRVPAAREALGLVAYRLGDWARALGEFRTVRRLSGSSHLLPLMVDCERALGRQSKALELAQSDEAGRLAIDERAELAIVVSGIRRDLGQLDAAAAGLTELVRSISPGRPSAPRLYYAFADAKLEAGDVDAAREWFARAADADHELTTDASERLDDLDGVEVTDLLDDEQGDTGGETGA